MRKFYLSLALFLTSFVSFADNETVCVITNTGSSGEACTSTALGPVDPCSSLDFKVKFILPTGYATVEKYEWFVNGISVKTSTNANDYVLPWTIVSKVTSVYCKVTYKQSNGTLSSPYTSTTLVPEVKALNFLEITTSTPPANYGCNNTVSYSLNTYSCGSLCNYTHTVTQYNITWQAPSGWVQTSISTNGNDVSFTPDASTGGTLTATITLPCGFTDTRTLTINRTAPAPTFSVSNPVAFCSSTGTLAINSICGATDYTYTIIGNSGVTFASNNLQTLTTSSTSVNLSLSGSASVNTLKVKANYPNSISSPEATTTFSYGTVQPGPIEVLMADATMGKIQVTIEPVPGATSYNWYKNGVAVTSQHGDFAQISITRNLCDVRYNIEVEAVNDCGTSSKTYKSVLVTCDESFMISPNPASNEVTISSNQTKSAVKKSFSEVRIYDLNGHLKKLKKYNSVKSATIDIADLNNGNYTIEVRQGNVSVTKHLLIQR